MPRHPPCALNNEHTNHPHNKKSCSGHTSELDKKLIKEKRNHTNTHKQTTRPIHLCLMLASTIQFSHNTPTTPCQHEPCQQALWSGTKKGDNAPDTQQCTNIQTTLFLVQLCMDNSVSQSAIQTLSSSLERVFHPDNFQFKKAGSMTLAYSTNQGCNCTRKIKAP